MKRSFAVFLIGFSGLCTLCMGQKFQVDTLQKTGPLNKRINIVILGDGFTQSELPVFDQEARKFSSFFLDYAPYNAYRNYVNIFSVRVPSAQSGATNPGTAADNDASQPVVTKNTYFGASFGTANVHRSVAIRNGQAFTNVMATNFPSYDLAIMIVNSPYYGGSGGNPATFTLHRSASLIAVHEVSHLFASLADEYWAGSGYARETPNMTRSADPASVTWKNWLNQPPIGIFQHTGDAAALNWYKPTTHNCLMEQLDKTLCGVCQEATVNKLLQIVKSVENVQPLPDSRILVNQQPETFQLSLLKPNPNTLRIEWRLNDVLLKQQVDQLTLANDQLPKAINTLRVSILDTTDLIRLGSHRQQHVYTYQWTLEKAAVGSTMAIIADKNAICTGETTTLTVSGCAGAVAWSTGATSPSITVSPTQSTTYSAVCTVPGTVSQTASSAVTVFPLPVIEVSNTGPYVENQAIQLRAQGGVRYAWTGPATFFSSEQNPVIPTAKMSQAGTYTVVVTTTGGCVGSAQTTVAISPVLATTGLPADVVWVFPNPANDRVQIQTTLPGELTVMLLDATGRQVLNQSFYRTTELTTGNLPKAVYIYRISNDQRTLTGKVVID